jgi:hypothetical protein
MLKQILVLALLLSLAPAAADAGREGDKKKSDAKTPWIHIEVLEDGEEGAKVNVNLPISLASAALKMVEDEEFLGEHFQFNGKHLTLDELRTLWKEVREAGDAEFVTVQEDDETVKVYRQGDMVFVEATDENNEERVRIQLPVPVVDALLGGKGDELDLEAAVEHLMTMTAGEIVRVEDGKDLVRIWID